MDSLASYLRYLRRLLRGRGEPPERADGLEVVTQNEQIVLRGAPAAR